MKGFIQTHSGHSDICLKVICAIIELREHSVNQSVDWRNVPKGEVVHSLCSFYENVIFLLIGWVLHGCFFSPFYLISDHCRRSGSFGGQPCTAVCSEAPTGCQSGYFQGGLMSTMTDFLRNRNWEIALWVPQHSGIYKIQYFLYFQRFILEDKRLQRAP